MSEDLRDLLLLELRTAVAARRAGGADPDELTAGLVRRLRRLQREIRATSPGRPRPATGDPTEPSPD
ncbi:hypothetical protein [Actinoplanes siamensis]|uniref:Uncharacterized protein n=1 Tax=Actinoplanes siamensis TaxID=1223317 RepID=A0A919N967_9ACTN|nr:hypothetical protein [Actinoplanes siamensis]GIF06844.1 hypothetical protein Asi03nite_43820 [Actinoplanes siamensis]